MAIITNKSDVLKIAKSRALAMPVDKTFTALDLLDGSEGVIPDVFVGDIGSAIADAYNGGTWGSSREDTLSCKRFTDSPKGRIRKFEWIGED